MPGIFHVTRTHVAPVVITMVCAYLFTWGATSLGIVALAFADASFHTAETGMLLVAFPIMLTVFLWSFISARPARARLLLLGAGVLMTVVAWALQRLLVD